MMKRLLLASVAAAAVVLSADSIYACGHHHRGCGGGCSSGCGLGCGGGCETGGCASGCAASAPAGCTGCTTAIGQGYPGAYVYYQSAPVNSNYGYYYVAGNQQPTPPSVPPTNPNATAPSTLSSVASR